MACEAGACGWRANSKVGKRAGDWGGGEVGFVSKRAGMPAWSSGHIMSDTVDLVHALAKCRHRTLQTTLVVPCAMIVLCMVGASQGISASCGWCHSHIGAECINALFRTSSITVLAMSTKALPLLSTGLAASLQKSGHS